MRDDNFYNVIVGRLQSVGAVQHVAHLVGNHVLDSLTSGLQVLTRIEIAGVFYEVLADGSGHSQTQVGVDINLANAEFAGAQQHIFRNALSAVQFATVFIALFYESGDNGGSAVEYQREAGEQVGDFFQTS